MIRSLRIPAIALVPVIALLVVAARDDGRGYGPTHIAGGATISFGHSHGVKTKTFFAFYDGHKDAYVNTDVSNRAQARRFHLNFAPALRKAIPGAVAPEYFVVGRRAAGQIAVFGAEPPDPGYSPLWQEFMVKWTAMAKPVVLTSDNEIFTMKHKGKLTFHATNIVINGPVTKLGS